MDHSDSDSDDSQATQGSVRSNFPDAQEYYGYPNFSQFSQEQKEDHSNPNMTSDADAEAESPLKSYSSFEGIGNEAAIPIDDASQMSCTSENCEQIIYDPSAPHYDIASSDEITKHGDFIRHMIAESKRTFSIIIAAPNPQGLTLSSDKIDYPSIDTDFFSILDDLPEPEPPLLIDKNENVKTILGDIIFSLDEDSLDPGAKETVDDFLKLSNDEYHTQEKINELREEVESIESAILRRGHKEEEINKYVATQEEQIKILNETLESQQSSLQSTLPMINSIDDHFKSQMSQNSQISQKKSSSESMSCSLVKNKTEDAIGGLIDLLHDKSSLEKDIKSQREYIKTCFKSENYDMSQMSQCVSNQRSIESCYAHSTAQIFKKFFQRFFKANGHSSDEKHAPMFLELFMRTEYWCIEYKQEIGKLNGFYSNGGKNETLGEPLIVDLLVEACGGNMYDYLSLSSFMFFYCLLRYGLTKKQYMTQEGGYYYSSITYVIQIMEKYRDFYKRGEENRIIIDEMIKDTGVARAECTALLEQFKTYFDSNQVIAVVGDDVIATPDRYHTTTISIPKTMNFIRSILDKNMYVGLVINGNKLHEKMNSQPLSQPSAQVKSSFNSHAITAAKMFLDLKQIEKASSLLDKNVDNDDVLKAIEIIDELNFQKGFYAKNSWGMVNEEGTDVGDGTIKFTIAKIGFHTNMGAGGYFGSCGINNFFNRNYPLYCLVLRNGIGEDIEVVFPKDKISDLNAKIGEINILIYKITEEKSKYIKIHSEFKMHVKNIEEKIQTCDILLKEINKIAGIDSQEEKVLKKAKSVLSESLQIKMLEKRTMDTEAVKNKVDDALSGLMSLEYELQLTQKDYVIAKKDLQFSMKYAINTGNNVMFQKLLDHFGPLYDLGDEYEYDKDTLGYSIYEFICKSYHTMINPHDILPILKTFFEYCIKNNYRINSYKREIYQIHTLDNLLVIPTIGGFINIMKGAQKLANDLLLLYDKYAAQGLFAVGSSHRIVIFHKNDAPLVQQFAAVAAAEPAVIPKNLTSDELFEIYKTKNNATIDSYNLAKMFKEQGEYKLIMNNRYGEINSDKIYLEKMSDMIRLFIDDNIHEEIDTVERDDDPWLYTLTKDQYDKFLNYLKTSKKFAPNSQSQSQSNSFGSLYAVGGKKTRRKRQVVRVKKNTRCKKQYASRKKRTHRFKKKPMSCKKCTRRSKK